MEKNLTPQGKKHLKYWNSQLYLCSLLKTTKETADISDRTVKCVNVQVHVTWETPGSCCGSRMGVLFIIFISLSWCDIKVLSPLSQWNVGRVCCVPVSSALSLVFRNVQKVDEDTASSGAKLCGDTWSDRAQTKVSACNVGAEIKLRVHMICEVLFINTQVIRIINK